MKLGTDLYLCTPYQKTTQLGSLILFGVGVYGLTVGRYVILLSILVALQLGFLIYGFIRQDKVDVLLDGAWQNAYETNPRSLQDIETRLQCCGYATVDDRAIPKDSKDACLLSPAFGYKISCKDQLRDSYLNHESAVMGVVAATEVLQVLALIATASLLNKIPHDGNVDFQRRNEHSRALLRGMCEEDRDLDPAVQSPSSDAAHDNGGSSRYGSITTPR
ncbi:hypothetical protein BGZ83_010451 [Gryganskiella cystojenkinii]|nr:hypothetical protein BGZ83_010451 [Gryganskiella cystojenkinii]